MEYAGKREFSRNISVLHYLVSKLSSSADASDDYAGGYSTYLENENRFIFSYGYTKGVDKSEGRGEKKNGPRRSHPNNRDNCTAKGGGKFGSVLGNFHRIHNKSNKL